MKEMSKLLKNTSKFIIVEFVLLLIVFIMCIRQHMGINNLGTLIILAFSFWSCLSLIPSFIAAICGLRYCLGKNNGKLIACWIWGCISLIINLGLIYIMNVSVEFTNTAVHIFLFLIFPLPNILYLIGCYKEQLKNRI